MKRRDPIIRALMIISLTIIILTLATRKTLCEIGFRNGSFEVVARLDCRSGKKGASMRRRFARLRTRGEDVQLRHPFNGIFCGSHCGWQQTHPQRPAPLSLCLR